MKAGDLIILKKSIRRHTISFQKYVRNRLQRVEGLVGDPLVHQAKDLDGAEIEEEGTK